MEPLGAQLTGISGAERSNRKTPVHKNKVTQALSRATPYKELTASEPAVCPGVRNSFAMALGRGSGPSPHLMITWSFSRTLKVTPLLPKAGRPWANQGHVSDPQPPPLPSPPDRPRDCPRVTPKQRRDRAPGSQHEVAQKWEMLLRFGMS